jgi:hypothetical protein
MTRELVEARNIVIIGITLNNPTPDITQLNSSRGVIAPRSSGLKLSNIRFINFISGSIIL